MAIVRYHFLNGQGGWFDHLRRIRRCEGEARMADARGRSKNWTLPDQRYHFFGAIGIAQEDLKVSLVAPALVPAGELAYLVSQGVQLHLHRNTRRRGIGGKPDDLV